MDKALFYQQDVYFSKKTQFQLTHFAGDAVPLGSPVRRIPKCKERFLRKPSPANLLQMGYMSTVSESYEHSCNGCSQYKSVPEDR